MPYPTNASLPASVKDNLPKHAQDIFRNAFNNALKQGSSEASAFKIAWSAVQTKYRKVGGEWMKKSFDITEIKILRQLSTPSYSTPAQTLVPENLLPKKRPKKKK